jgi:hypothetical protein
MKTVGFIAPPDSGTARITIIGSHGVSRLWREGQGSTSITTPYVNRVEIRDAAPGSYIALIEPLGEPAVVYPFVLDETDDEVRAPAIREIREIGDIAPPESWRIEVAAEESSRSLNAHADTGATSLSPQVLDDVRLPNEAERTQAPCFSVGLSADMQAFRYGRWRPYVGPWPTSITSTAETVVLTIKRGYELLVRHQTGNNNAPSLEDRTRLLLSIAIEALCVQRLLVPVFAGGVQVKLALDSLQGLSVDVLPVDSEKKSLVRALSTAIGDEAEAIWTDFAKNKSVSDYIYSGTEEDPWIAIVAVLICMRFPNIDDSQVMSWATTLADRYSWIPDCHIVLARMRLLSAGNSREDRISAADKALDGLCIARRRGAPFFAYSNTLLRDMLTTLADGAPAKRQRSRAAAEIVGWRRHLPHQKQAGASFSWTITNGARSYGGVDSRYSSVLVTGIIQAKSFKVKKDTVGATAQEATARYDHQQGGARQAVQSSQVMTNCDVMLVDSDRLFCAALGALLCTTRFCI